MVNNQALAVNVNGLTAPAVQWQVAGTPAARVAGMVRQPGAGVTMQSGDAFTDIPGATAPTLPVTDALRGSWVRVVVSYTDGSGAAQSATSDPALVPTTKAGPVRIKKAASGAPGGKSTAKVKWAPTTTGGMPILGYKVVALRVRHGHVVSRHGTKVDADVHGVKMRLHRGHYRFKVRALTDLGRGRATMTKVVRAR